MTVNQYNKQSGGSNLGIDIAGYKAGSSTEGNVLSLGSDTLTDEGVILRTLFSLASMSLEESVLEEKTARDKGVSHLLFPSLSCYNNHKCHEPYEQTSADKYIMF